MDLNSLLSGLVTALLANLVFAAFVALFAILASRAISRRRVRHFFGISARKGSLPIYVSNIYVNPDVRSSQHPDTRATIGTERIDRGFYGTAISEVEYYHALLFAAAVETRPAIRALRAVVPDDHFVPPEPIVCRIEPSPFIGTLADPVLRSLRDRVGNNSIVVVGAPVYNTLAKHLLGQLESRVRFIRDPDSSKPVQERGIEFTNWRNEKMAYFRTNPPPDSGEPLEEYYVVEKLEWPVASGSGRQLQAKTRVFICAGTCSAATAAALRLLERNWLRLSRETGGNNFGILCKLLLANEKLREAHLDEAEVPRNIDYYGFEGLILR
jgi:hypothetical protein